jgi:hypothetical protein
MLAVRRHPKTDWEGQGSPSCPAAPAVPYFPHSRAKPKAAVAQPAPKLKRAPAGSRHRVRQPLAPEDGLRRPGKHFFFFFAFAAAQE